MRKMVYLFNILIQNGKISCEYIPEKSGSAGHIVIDTKTFEVEKIGYSDYKYGKNMFVAQVRSKLEELYKTQETMPKEAYAI